MNKMQQYAFFAIALCSFSSIVQAQVAREDILILNENGRDYTAYKTLRSDLPKRQVTLDAQESAGDLIYFHPDNYTATPTTNGNGQTLLSFDGGSYALMRTGRFTNKELAITSDGVYQFSSWNGQTLANGHYGKWNTPNPFTQFSYVWVVPDNIEILKYNANQKGEWQRSGQTLAWTGKDVNDLTFEITYRVGSAATIRPTTLGETPAPADASTSGLSRITLDSGSLFPSGSHRFTGAGEKVLTELAEKLRRRNASKIIVEGHTDNQPLKPYLRETYPSNWELSAARATIVVRWLAEHGVDADILEARAYGEQRPVADNSSAQGRAKNRRIEILVEDKTGRSPRQASAKKVDRTQAPSSNSTLTVPKAKPEPPPQPALKNRATPVSQSPAPAQQAPVAEPAEPELKKPRSPGFVR